jgi:hypothetical protein
MVTCSPKHPRRESVDHPNERPFDVPRKCTMRIRHRKPACTGGFSGPRAAMTGWVVWMRKTRVWSRSGVWRERGAREYLPGMSEIWSGLHGARPNEGDQAQGRSFRAACEREWSGPMGRTAAWAVSGAAWVGPQGAREPGLSRAVSETTGWLWHGVGRGLGRLGQGMSATMGSARA